MRAVDIIMKKRNGFTLIELLAVIVILAVILVIAIPRILDVIEESKVNTFKSTAQLIADSAEKKKVSDKLLGKDESITCKDVAKISDEDYKSCTITFDENGIAKVSISGKGKFKGLKVIEATKTSIEVIKLEPPKYGIKAVEYINGLYEYDSDTNNLKIDNTPDANIRYHGLNPNNYVSFNNELWRIIGVFGNNVKLVRKDMLGSLSWDSSDSTINNGNGINQWGESTYEDGTPYEGADLMLYLNKMYYGGETVTCYGGENNATTTCPTETLNGESKNMIENYTWNTGGVEGTAKTDTLAFYQAERGTKTGKICSSGTYCNDTVNRTTTWTGSVALPYATDYAYASSESDCETNMQMRDSSNNYICKNNNWMFKPNTRYWTLSPSATSGHSRSVWYVLSVGGVGDYYAAGGGEVFPAIYLKTDVLIKSGNGSESNPYILRTGA